GYTLFMGNNSTHGSNPALYAKLPYDAVKDFAPISMVASVPYVLIVNPSLPVSTLEQLIAMAKSQPGKINYASAGNGSTHHFCGELLKSMAGIDLVHVPYKGSPPGVTAVVAGEVGMMFANLTDIGGQLRSAKVKPLAVTSPTRAAADGVAQVYLGRSTRHRRHGLRRPLCIRSGRRGERAARRRAHAPTPEFGARGASVVRCRRTMTERNRPTCPWLQCG